METLDEVLSHYGIKGMKWGVRRDRTELARARGRRVPPSPDAVQARESLKKAKKGGGAKALSNKELQQLNARLNLEQNFKSLTKQPGKLAKGQKYVKSVLGMGKTVNEAVAFVNSPVGKQATSLILKRKP